MENKENYFIENFDQSGIVSIKFAGKFNLDDDNDNNEFEEMQEKLNFEGGIGEYSRLISETEMKKTIAIYQKALNNKQE